MPKVFSIFDTNDGKVKENIAIKWNIYCTLLPITHWPYKKYLYRKSIEIETKEMMFLNTLSLNSAIRNFGLLYSFARVIKTISLS